MLDTILNIYIKAEITSLPVDLGKICRALGVTFSTYEDYAELKNISHEDVCRMFLEDGFTISGASKKVIVYNERNTNLLRRRFTIAHEIAHILLKHLENSKKENEGINNDRAANILAWHLLCPIQVLQLMGVSTVEEIAEACQVSYSVSKKCHEYLTQKRNSSDLFKDELDKEMAMQFLQYISNYHTIKSTKHNSLRLSPQKLNCY